MFESWESRMLEGKKRKELSLLTTNSFTLELHRENVPKKAGKHPFLWFFVDQPHSLARVLVQETEAKAMPWLGQAAAQRHFT